MTKVAVESNSCETITGGQVQGGLPTQAQTDVNSVTEAIRNWEFNLVDIFTKYHLLISG